MKELTGMYLMKAQTKELYNNLNPVPQ